METSESTLQEYFQRETGASGWGAHRIAAWVMLPLGLIGLVTRLGGLTLFLVWGSLSLCIASWARKKPIVRLLKDHLEVKAAPLASRKCVRYEEIERLETVAPTKAKLWLKCGATLRLPIAALEPEQRTALTAAIDAKLGGVS